MGSISKCDGNVVMATAMEKLDLMATSEGVHMTLKVCSHLTFLARFIKTVRFLFNIVSMVTG